MRRYELLATESPSARHDQWRLRFPEIDASLTLHVRHGHYEDNAHVARMMADSVATLPALVLRSLPETMLAMDQGSTDGAIYLDYTDQPEGYHVVEFAAVYAHENDNTLDWSFEELLVHELGHVFDVGLYNIRNSAGWKAAKAQDNGAHVTDYAETNDKEDFAETFAVWLALRHDKARPIGERRLTKTHHERAEQTI